MQCGEVTERLLDDQRQREPELDQHVSECVRCAHVARGLRCLDAILTTSLVVQPPLELQQQLAQLVLAAPRSSAESWWRRAGRAVDGLNPATWLAKRPHLVAAQGLAAVMLTLASWQVFGWVTTFQPIVGDIGYALQLVAASPASVYFNSMQLDVQSLGLWCMVGIGGWLISEEGVIGRSLARRQQSP